MKKKKKLRTKELYSRPDYRESGGKHDGDRHEWAGLLKADIQEVEAVDEQTD